MTINLSVLGASGKMGKRVLHLATSDSQFHIVGGTATCCTYRTIGELIGDVRIEAPLFTEANLAFAKCDVAIDFTLRDTTLAHLKAAVLAKKPLVIGTSGQTEDEKSQIAIAATQIPILLSPNFSLGMALCLEAVSKMGKALYGASTIDIIETHHVHKKDSPSGTALALGCAICSGKTVSESSSAKPRNKEEIVIHSIRSGEVIGEHIVIFECGHERIELKHTAHSRDAFAHGALMGAKFLANQPPGLYSIKDLFNPR